MGVLTPCIRLWSTLFHKFQNAVFFKLKILHWMSKNFQKIHHCFTYKWTDDLPTCIWSHVMHAQCLCCSLDLKQLLHHPLSQIQVPTNCPYQSAATRTMLYACCYVMLHYVMYGCMLLCYVTLCMDACCYVKLCYITLCYDTVCMYVPWLINKN